MSVVTVTNASASFTQMVMPTQFNYTLTRASRSDGSHPAAMGTYLAACVFYAVIFGQRPVGLSFRGDLSASDARVAQKAAGDSVLGANPAAVLSTLHHLPS